MNCTFLRFLRIILLELIIVTTSLQNVSLNIQEKLNFLCSKKDSLLRILNEFCLLRSSTYDDYMCACEG